jgi:hypothetical protein
VLQELATRTGATVWAVASMLFFFGIWLAIVVRVARARPEDLEARARLALEGDGRSRTEEVPSGAGTEA